MSYRDAAQVRAEHVASMGSPLGELYSGLWNECAWLHCKWGEFTALFGTSAARIELLNRSAAQFFGMIQASLFEDVVLHIARLNDQAATGRKKNLTLGQLPPLVDAAIRSGVEDAIATANAKAAFARDWRNRHIAHRDLELSFGRAARPLEAASRLHAREAIEAIVAVLNVVAGHYEKAHLHFENGLHNGGAEGLLYVLRDGLEMEERRRKRLKSGQLLREDLEPDVGI